MEILKHVNWVDILLLAVGIRVIYMGIQTGFAEEFMNLLAVIAATFVSMNYYMALSGTVARAMFPPGTLHVTAFVVLCIFTLLICWFIRSGFFMLFTIQAQSAVDKWGGAIISVFRFLIAGSLILFALVVSENKYFDSMVAGSFSGGKVLKVAPAIYNGLSDYVVRKLLPDQKKNSSVALVLKQTK